MLTAKSPFEQICLQMSKEFSRRIYEPKGTVEDYPILEV